MTGRLAAYLALVDRLREQRKIDGWKPIDDRPLLAEMEDMYVELSDADREEVERQGGRSRPEWQPRR